MLQTQVLRSTDYSHKSGIDNDVDSKISTPKYTHYLLFRISNTVDRIAFTK